MQRRVMNGVYLVYGMLLIVPVAQRFHSLSTKPQEEIQPGHKEIQLQPVQDKVEAVANLEEAVVAAAEDNLVEVALVVVAAILHW